MRKLCVSLLALLALATPLAAQRIEPGRHLFSGVWRGHGYVFAFRLVLEVEEKTAGGHFRWTLLDAPAAIDGPPRLAEGNEWVTGEVADGGVLRLRGLGVDRADLLSTAIYELRRSAGGTLTGRTRSEGKEWDGAIAGLTLPPQEPPAPTPR